MVDAGWLGAHAKLRQVRHLRTYGCFAGREHDHLLEPWERVAAASVSPTGC